jgi:hydroxymethylpyrimidine pyrophosphatase-like HAD family hydrolase
MRFTENNGQAMLSLGDTFALQTLEAALRADRRPKLVVSDFDDTLCHQYTFDGETNNHAAIIDERVVEAARALPLLIATATRAEHPKIKQIWESGLLPANGRLIAENGGVIVNNNGDVLWAAVERDTVDTLHQHVLEALPDMFALPQDIRLIAKKGLTMLVVRAQRQNGQPDPHIQTELQDALQQTVGSTWSVVDGGRSLSVQHPNVNKLAGVNRTGLSRRDYCVVGFGDSPNDIPLLAGADVAIAVGERIAAHADIVLEASPAEIASVLRCIGSTSTQFSGWRTQNEPWKGAY